MTTPGTRPLALVTGASSGLGLEFARLLAAEGWDVALCARNRAALEAIRVDLEGVHGGRAYVLARDLSRGPEVEALLVDLRGLDRPLDLLVANAGMGLHGPYLHTDAAAERDMLRLNVESTVGLVRGVLPDMVARGRGRILTVGSVGSFTPGPLMTTYYATKAFVLSYSDALAEELAGTGVSVTCLCPGPLRTPFLERAGARSSGAAEPGIVDTRDVARAGLDAALAGRRRVVPGWLNKVSATLPRLLPRTLMARLVHRVQASRR